jgi:lipoyl(octanoyl) transferase
MPQLPKIRRFPQLVDYLSAWEYMRTFTTQRDTGTPDEIWLLQHTGVYTLGLNGRRENMRDPGSIPVVHTDRGGQVTYHGPGQLIVYILLDLNRLGLGVKTCVAALEQAVIDLCKDYGINAQRCAGAPGVYVHGQKLMSVGLRIRRACTYHGLALNVNMDLQPFRGINPCGYPGLEVTQLQDLGVTATPQQIGEQLLPPLLKSLKYEANALCSTV